MSDERNPPDPTDEPAADEPGADWQPSAPPPPGWPSPPPAGGPPAWPAPPPADAQPGPGGVHPLTIGRAFSVGWSLFRFRWRRLIAITLLVMVPGYLPMIAWTVGYGEIFEQWSYAVQPDPLNVFPDPSQLAPLPLEGVALAFVAQVMASIAAVLATGALIHMIGWTYGGGGSTAGRSLRTSLGRALSLVGATLLIALTVAAIVIGASLAIGAAVGLTGFEAGPAALVLLIAAVTAAVAVVFLVLRWAFTLHAVMLEGAGAVAGLRRSWGLASGSTWRVLGYVLLLGLVVALLGMVAGILGILLFGFGVDFQTLRPDPFSPVRAAGNLVLNVLVVALSTPFVVAVSTLLYYDLRWRRGEAIGPPPA